MSKRDQFKALLSDSGDTGTSQKGRILDSHLVPPNTIEGNPSTKSDGQVNQERQTSSTGDSPSDQLDKSGAVFQQDQGNTDLSGRSTDPTDPSMLKPSGQSQPPGDSFRSPVQNGITSLVSNLKNMDELNVEDTHTRKTYLIDNQLLAELDAISAGKKKGYKTKIINTGLRIVLELMRQDNSFKL